MGSQHPTKGNDKLQGNKRSRFHNAGERKMHLYEICQKQYKDESSLILKQIVCIDIWIWIKAKLIKLLYMVQYNETTMSSEINQNWVKS